jgi:hypothetical protein
VLLFEITNLGFDVGELLTPGSTEYIFFSLMSSNAFSILFHTFDNYLLSLLPSLPARGIHLDSLNAVRVPARCEVDVVKVAGG